MNELKNCMFQYATSFNNRYFSDTKIYEDTDLITLDEAKELFTKWKHQFIKELKDGDRPQMVIWTNCSDNTSYGDEYINVDETCEIIGDDIYIFRKEKVSL